MDQSTWDMWYKPLIPKAEPIKAETAEPETAPATPIATVVAASAPGSTPIQTTPTTGFSRFQVQSAAPERQAPESRRGESGGGSRRESSAGGGTLTVDQQIMQQHWQTMHDMGIAQIGNSINPLDENRDPTPQGVFGAASGMHWAARPPMESRDGGISPMLPTPVTTPGNIGAAPSAPSSVSPAASGANSMATGVASVLAKLEAIIAAIGREAGILEKVFS